MLGFSITALITILNHINMTVQIWLTYYFPIYIAWIFFYVRAQHAIITGLHDCNVFIWEK